jgi:hypothetical protein
MFIEESVSIQETERSYACVLRVLMFIKMSVSIQETERSYTCVLGVLI